MFLFLLSFLFLEDTFMPEPTKEIMALVENLGNERFFVREKADKELRELGWPALKAVYHARKSPDAEIAHRAIAIYEKYFRVYSDDKEVPIPSIWYINEKSRFPKGFKLEPSKKDSHGSSCKLLEETTDIAREYYMKIKTEWEEQQKKSNPLQQYTESGWTNEAIAKEATMRYLKDRMLLGEKRGDLKKEINQWVENSKQYLHYMQIKDIETDVPIYNWDENPPGPMIKKDDFKYPYLGP